MAGSPSQQLHHATPCHAPGLPDSYTCGAQSATICLVLAQKALLCCRSHAGLERVLDGLLTVFKILTPFLVSLGLALHALSMQHMLLAAPMADNWLQTSTQS